MATAAERRGTRGRLGRLQHRRGRPAGRPASCQQRWCIHDEENERGCGQGAVRQRTAPEPGRAAQDCGALLKGNERLQARRTSGRRHNQGSQCCQLAQGRAPGRGQQSLALRNCGCIQHRCGSGVEKPPWRGVHHHLLRPAACRRNLAPGRMVLGHVRGSCAATGCHRPRGQRCGGGLWRRGAAGGGGAAGTTPRAAPLSQCGRRSRC